MRQAHSGGERRVRRRRSLLKTREKTEDPENDRARRQMLWVQDEKDYKIAKFKAAKFDKPVRAAHLVCCSSVSSAVEYESVCLGETDAIRRYAN